MFINSRILRLKTLRAFFSTEQIAPSFSITPSINILIQALYNQFKDLRMMNIIFLNSNQFLSNAKSSILSVQPFIENYL